MTASAMPCVSIGTPKALAWTGSSVCQVTAVMDQHAFMTVAPGVELRIGDIISFGTSHPCLTFDKWQVGCLVDEQLQVVESLRTCF